MKTYDYKWIDFLSGNNTIKVTNKNEFSKFKDFLNYLGLTDILNGINTFSDFQNLARINNTNENMFLFEYVNHKGLTWNDDIKKSTEWYGKEPINVSELEITKPKMKLYDLLKIKDCIDTYDTKYDTVVPIDMIRNVQIEGASKSEYEYTINEVCGMVGEFWKDNALGYTETEPELVQENLNTVLEEISAEVEKLSELEEIER